MTDESRVQDLLEQLLDSGGTPEEVCRDCPELLPAVRAGWQELRALEAEVGALFPQSTPECDPKIRQTRPEMTKHLPCIGGYEVQKVLGHGGMGVVYKAWHLRLHRPVALKMLLAGPVAQPTQLERFLREAQAIAALHHSNIVQVYDVGDVDGRPYFTMEFLEGGNLAERIQGVPQPARQAADLVATLAEAIHAAHQSGIVHRDLKPANILLTADGTPKVTDFGLARRLEGDGGLTLSGSPLGTPSYMAPEQARGDRHAIGPATDVYALGAILYELLTGRPPFRAESSTATLQQVVADDPVPPARLNPQVPRDLTTICLKCLHKEPGKRYRSAAALADDLRRFHRGEPIAARPAGPLERLTRWARRRPAATALLVILLLGGATLLGSASWLIGRLILTGLVVRAELQEADRLQQQSALPEAGVALERARSRLGDSGPPWLYPVLEVARRDHQFPIRLEAIRLNRLTLAEAQQTHDAMLRFNNVRADEDYAEAFRDQGLGKPLDDSREVAARVRSSRWAIHLIAALDDWAVCAAVPARQDWLLEVARLADPDPWRDRVRDPAVWRDGEALAELARTLPPGQPVPLLLALGERLSATGKDGVGFLRQLQEKYAEDFWANFTLALALHGAGRRPGGDPAAALAYYQKALEIRPQAVAVRNDLGVVLFDRNWMWDNELDGRGPGAATVFYEVVKSDPHFAPGFNNLGTVLKGRGDWGMAVLVYRDALRIDPRLVPAHLNLGEILAGSGPVNEAIDHYRQTLQHDPDCAKAHHLLGVALLAKGRRDEVDDCYPEGVKTLEFIRGQALADAITFYWHAFYCEPEWTLAWNPLRITPQDEARLNEAIDHLRQAVRLDPQFALAHGALGQALLARRQFTEAEAQTQRCLDLLPKGEKNLRANLEGQLLRCQRLRALERRLAAVVQGTDNPAIGDCLELAELCFVEKQFARAVPLYARALAGTPHLAEDLRVGHRFNAARAAAQAGGGHGDVVAGFREPERAALRKQARDWLRLDLDAWVKKVDTGTEADRIQAQKALAPWRDDPDLAGLRDAGTLLRLSPAERQECWALWHDLDALLTRIQGFKFTTEKLSEAVR